MLTAPQGSSDGESDGQARAAVSDVAIRKQKSGGLPPGVTECVGGTNQMQDMRVYTASPPVIGSHAWYVLPPLL
eukprot:1184715-Prorocentrum_minimum.AAC.2